MSTWHKNLYDQRSADATINSPQFRKLARQQTQDLAKLLDLKKGQAVLDVPCGTGRHTVELAKRGLEVTAIDINPTLIKTAKKHLRAARAAAKLARADMSNLKRYKNRFDLVANLFSSIGYFATDRQNEQVIGELFRAVKPGGALVIDTINPDFLMTIFRSSSWHPQPKGRVAAEIRQLEPGKKYIQAIQCFYDPKTGQAHAHYHRLRLYRAPELKKILRRLGAKQVDLYATLGGEPFERLKSRRIVLVARR